MKSSFKDTWEYFGKHDPYFAVLTDDKYKSEHLTDAARSEFFRTGDEHIQVVWKDIQEHFVEQYRPARALDFGCGVGRLVIPMASKCDQVVGVDISAEMLAEARRNCDKQGMENAAFYSSDALTSGSLGQFDFIHSFIVFQHIDPEIGDTVFEKLLELLTDKGIGAIHLTYSVSQNRFAFFRARVYRDFPLINRLKNIVRGRRNRPAIPVFLYDLNRIFTLLQKHNCHKCLVRFSDHGAMGVFLLFQKMSHPIY